jgi:hypothetical protein
LIRKGLKKILREDTGIQVIGEAGDDLELGDFLRP